LGFLHHLDTRVIHLSRGHQALHQEEDGLLSEGLLGVKNFATFKVLRINRYWFFMVFNILTLTAIGVIPGG
jgi:hypothetical protein